MTVKDFLDKLSTIEVKIETISAVYRTFVYEFKDELLVYDKNQVCEMLQAFTGESFASFGVKLGRCLSDCQEERKNLSTVADTLYAQNVAKVEKLIEGLVSLYYDVANKKTSKKDSTEATLSQHDEYLEEVKTKLKDLNTAVDNANKLIDDKIFTLLINTVAILGIFVAIAFAGFGITNIFSNLDFAKAFASRESLVKSVFFLLLTAVLSYNLLLLLVYFIYKLSRPLVIRVSKDDKGGESQETFVKTMNLIPFIWVDCIMTALTIVAFIVCVCIW